MSPPSQCLPTTRASTGGAVERREARVAEYVGRIERGPDVVAHPAVDGDVEAAGTAVQRDGLDGADPVEGESAGTADRATRLDRQVRNADVER